MSESTQPPPLSDDLLKDDDDEDLFASAIQSTSRLTLSTTTAVDTPAANQSVSSDIAGDEIDLNNDEESTVQETSHEKDESSCPSPVVATGSIGQSNSVDTSNTSATNVSSSAVLPTSVEAKNSPSTVASLRPSSSSPSQSSDVLIEIKVGEPKKLGDGYGSYVVYKVSTRTNLPFFRRPSSAVNRRFSDFRGLRDKLAEKHLYLGRIVPPAPKKDAVGTAKVKMSKDDDLGHDEFIEKRRLGLERFLNRVAAHEVLRADPDFREFLELDTELPRAVDSSALSSAGVMRFFNKFGDKVNKLTYRMDESNPQISSNPAFLSEWFEDKSAQIENLDIQLRKLQQSVDALIHHRRELATTTGAFAKSCAILGNFEEHTSLSCALSQLADTEEKVEQVYKDQVDSDFLHLSEMIRDYISLIGAIKEILHQRIKVFHAWQNAQQQLVKKREQKARSELSGRSDKAAQVAEEVNEWKAKVDRGQQEFEDISRNIRVELEKFELNRVQEFKNNIVKYMESLLETQQQLIKHWESFLPDAKSISTA